MSNGTGAVVQATAFSAYYIANGVASALSIGPSTYASPTNPTSSEIWLVVIDLTNLQVVANDVSDGSNVPADITQYAGNPRYFLFAISNNAWASQMPQGNLWNLLTNAGSGPQLARLQQIYTALSTGYLGTFSYILAATLAEDDLPGFETLSLTNFTILTMGFLPITVNGQTMYAPVQPGA